MRRMRNWLFVGTTLFLTTLAYGAATESPEAANKKMDALKVVLETNKGDIVLMLTPEEAPVTVNNFIEYVESGFYNGLVFHRVINNFMIQGGGFTADMSQRATRAPIKNESLLNQRLENRRGSIAMARTQIVDSATSQFFINLKDNEFLNGKPYKAGYAVFGHVVKGMEVVDTIAGVKTGYRGPHGDVPVDSVIINKAYVVKEGESSAKTEPVAS
ncbi:peptidylprolyl isomerase [Endozoicomonas sp. SCSIO W0465]|uniref:peptidylprolyl isomerase n=1 Tax=Endozoicomonas sp. SCSIO W0465 TaxID=2918516 RepID=UPI0035328037